VTLRVRPPRGWAAWTAIAAAVLLLVLWLARAAILHSLGVALYVRDTPQPAELIYQFGCGFVERSRVSAELYHRGLAPRIVLMRVYQDPALWGTYPNETEISVRILLGLGVPRSAIEVYRSGDGTSSTTEEAEMLNRVLRRDGRRRVIAVTSWYHTRRARWALRRALGDLPARIQMAAAPTTDWDENNWWRHEAGAIAIAEEYLKLLHNWVYR
jgi:uncharacterized SAM-binding protein YcdF (DUF218 family)